MSDLDLSDAINVAARANYERHYRAGAAWEDLDGAWLASARAIVRPIVEAAAPLIIAAAAPLIEAWVRAHVAAEIEASIGTEPVLMHVVDWTDGVEYAARIARGDS